MLVGRHGAGARTDQLNGCGSISTGACAERGLTEHVAQNARPQDSQRDCVACTASMRQAIERNLDTAGYQYRDRDMPNGFRRRRPSNRVPQYLLPPDRVALRRLHEGARIG